MTNLINPEVLKRTLVALFGDEGLAAVSKGYDAINAAMASAYAQGYQASEEAKASDAEVRDEDRLQFEWDDGYAAGADDARRDPAECDRHLASLSEPVDDLTGDAHFYAYYGDDDFDDGGPYNEANVSDSGDENDMPCIQTLCDIRG